MREIVLSTDNINKLREIREILEDLDIKIYGKSDIEGLDFEVIEDGDTLYDNALKKASAMAERVDYAVLADDTGLFVKALNGEPGVHSARYASEHDDKKNREKLLNNLKDKEDRSAYFKTEIILIDEDKNIIPIEGVCPGKISLEERGDNGFGYDSIFIPDGFDKTFAEMSHEEKNQISHRAKALENLKKYFTELIWSLDKDITFCYYKYALMWWVWPSWLRRQIVVLKIVGSIPTIHPTIFKKCLALLF